MCGDIFQDMGPSVVCLPAHGVKHPECLVGVGGSLILAVLKQQSLLSAGVTVVVAACHSTTFGDTPSPGPPPVPRCGPSAPSPAECAPGWRLSS